MENKIAIILQCTKDKQPGKLPAIKSYSGRNFNKILPMVQPLGDIFILSSKYGLISGDTIIEPYDSTFEVLPPGYVRDYSLEYRREFRNKGVKQQLKMIPVVQKQLPILNGYNNIITIMSRNYLNVFNEAGGNKIDYLDWQEKCGGIFNLPKHIEKKINENVNNHIL